MLYDLGVDSVDGDTSRSLSGRESVVLYSGKIDSPVGDWRGITVCTIVHIPWQDIKKYEKKHLTALLRGQGEFD